MKFKDIPTSDSWNTIQYIEKGLSSDEKYLINTKTGTKFLLGIAEQDSLRKDKHL